MPADAYVSVGRVRARATDGYPRAGAQPGSTPGAGAMTSTLEDLWGRTLRLDKEERSDMSYLLAALIAYLRQREADVVAHATGEVIRHTDDWKFSDIETVVRERDALAARVRELEGERDRLRGDFECAVKEGRSAERVVDHRIVEAVAAEREACAKLCEEQLVEWQESGATGQPQLALAAAARYIRSRPTPATGGREYEEGVVVLRVPFEPNVPLIRESLEKHFGSADPPPSAPGEVCTTPIPAILVCPSCQGQHIDHGEWAQRPHKTHLCEHCACEFRFANVPTVGVKELPAVEEKASGSRTAAVPMGGPSPAPRGQSLPEGSSRDGDSREQTGASPAPSVEELIRVDYTLPLPMGGARVFVGETPLWVSTNGEARYLAERLRTALAPLLTRAREEGRREALEQAARECVLESESWSELAEAHPSEVVDLCAHRIRALTNRGA